MSNIDTPEREAKCDFCGEVEKSSKDLPFFIYRGKGSKYSKEYCKNCKYTSAAHRPTIQANNPNICKNFEPHGPFQYDLYYCGCGGWD